MSDEQPDHTIIQIDTAEIRLTGEEVVIWLSSSSAPKWFDDTIREAASVGPDARRREIVFAVCFAESYLVEWVRSEVLKNSDLRRLSDYFPPGGLGARAGQDAGEGEGRAVDGPSLPIWVRQ